MSLQRLPIQTPILDRLGDMLFVNACTAIQIGNGTGYFKDAGVGTSRETEAVGDQLQYAIARGVQFTVFLDEAWGHLGVAVLLAIRQFLFSAPHPAKKEHRQLLTARRLTGQHQNIDGSICHENLRDPSRASLSDFPET